MQVYSEAQLAALRHLQPGQQRSASEGLSEQCAAAPEDTLGLLTERDVAVAILDALRLDDPAVSDPCWVVRHCPSPHRVQLLADALNNPESGGLRAAVPFLLGTHC